MFKYFIWILKLGPRILWNYFTWMRAYARHPERYTNDERFRRGQRFAKIILRGLKVDVEIRNAPLLTNEEVYFFIGNHTSMMDALIVLANMQVPVAYVSKKENRELPFVSTMFKIVGGVYIERENLKQEIRAMQQLRESLAGKDTSWVLFPEGTRNRNYHTNLLEYKAGSFKAPLQTKTTIVPFVLQGAQLILPRKTRARRYKVIMEYLPVVVPEGTTLTLAESLHAATLATVERLKLEYRDTQKLNKYGREMITPPEQRQ